MKRALITLIFISPFLLLSQISLEKDYSIKQALGIVENQLAVKFNYSESAINTEAILGKQFENSSLDNFLQYLYQNHQIKYTQSSEVILLFPDIELRVKAIMGYVLDKNTQEPLIFATLFDTVSKKHTITNEHGYYALLTEKKEAFIVVRFLGKKTELSHLKLKNDINKNFLLEDNTSLNQIVIKADNILGIANTAGKFEIADEIMNLQPAIAGIKDPVNTIKYLPGITSNNFNNRINVRGGGLGGNLFVIDGVELLKMNHWAMSTVISGDAINKTTFYKSNFPVFYTGRTSSVLDMRIKQGNREKFEISGGAGIEYANLSFEGPIGKNSSFFVSARKNYGIKNIFSPYYNLVLRTPFSFGRHYDVDQGDFKDVFGKYSYYFPKSIIRISGMFENDVRKEHNYYKTSDVIVRGNYYKTSTGFASLNYLLNIKNNAIFSSQLTYYLNQSSYQKNNLTLVSPTNSFEIKDLIDDVTKLSLRKQNIETYILNNKLEINTKNSQLNMGLNSTARRFVDEIKDSTTDYREQSNYIFEMNAFFSYKQSFGKKMEVYLGLSNHTFKNEEFIDYKLEPRLSIDYKFKKSSLDLSYMRVNQYLHYNYFDLSTSVFSLFSGGDFYENNDYWIPADSNTGVTISDQLSLSYNKVLTNNIKIITSLYYKKIKNLRDDFINTYRASSDNKSYGSEFLIEKTEGKFKGWLSYDLSWSKYKPNQLMSYLYNLKEHEVYSSRDDVRHKFRFVLNYEINKKLSVGMQFKFNTGRPFSYNLDSIPYSSLDTVYYISDKRKYFGWEWDATILTSEKEVLSGKEFRSPIHHEMDIQLVYSFGKKWKSKIIFGWKNAMGTTFLSDGPFLYIYNDKILIDFNPTWYPDDFFEGMYPYLTYRFTF